MSKTKLKTKTGVAKKPTATQRLNTLENLLAMQNKKFEILADEIDKSRNLITSLAKRLNATISAGESGDISTDTVNKLIVNSQVAELKGRVDSLVKSGLIQSSPDLVVGDNTFVVGQEVDAEGTVVNPRIQFPVGSLPEDFKSALMGKKVGDLIQPNAEIPVSMEIVELFEIVAQDQEKDFTAKEAQA